MMERDFPGATPVGAPAVTKIQSTTGMGKFGPIGRGSKAEIAPATFEGSKGMSAGKPDLKSMGKFDTACEAGNEYRQKSSSK